MPSNCLMASMSCSLAFMFPVFYFVSGEGVFQCLAQVCVLALGKSYDKGTQEMFARESRSRNRWFERTAQISYCIAPDGCSSPEERKKAKKKFKEASKNYFDI